MRVFISWSGETSQKFAHVLRRWLPFVLQSVSPFVSSDDIQKGARWSAELARELRDSSYGLLCVTADNVDAKWLNFEAGALSVAFESSRVSPVLLNVRKSDLSGPLTQFQATACNKDDVHLLLQSINEACGERALSEERLHEGFRMWWPRLESDVAEILHVPSNQTPAPRSRGQKELLEEVLNLVRDQQRMLSQTLMEPEKLVAMIRDIPEADVRLSLHITPKIIGELATAWHRLEISMQRIESGKILSSDAVREIWTSRSIVEGCIRHLSRSVDGSNPPPSPPVD